MKKTLKQNKSRNYGNLLIVIAVVILDQFTKYLVKTGLNLNESIPLIKNFLNLAFITNTGSIFGILKGANAYLIFFSLIVLGLILVYHDKIKKKEQIFFSIIVGGIIGNFIDRIFYGKVIDFISFTFWPAFNIADSAICIGVIGLIIMELRK